MRRAYQAQLPLGPGVALALKEASRGGRSQRLPSLLVFPETLPKARVVRALGRPGMILVSQGMLATYSDDELVTVLRQALKLNSESGIVLNSACESVSMRLARSNHGRRGGWTPFRALVRLMLFPLLESLRKKGRKSDVFYSMKAMNEMKDPSWISAMRKAACVERIFS